MKLIIGGKEHKPIPNGERLSIGRLYASIHLSMPRVASSLYLVSPSKGCTEQRTGYTYFDLGNVEINTTRQFEVRQDVTLVWKVEAKDGEEAIKKAMARASTELSDSRHYGAYEAEEK